MISNKAWLALWLFIFVLLIAWRAQNLDAFGLSNDEGAHLMWARLAVDGYPLYSETHAVQAPLFIESIGWAFRLGGQTIQAGRWVILASFGLLAVTVSWLAYRTGGWPASLLALLLLGISPLIFTFSRLVMAEVPATGLAVTSLVLLFVFLKRSHRGWLVASGLVLGLSFITKALNPFVIVPVGLLLLIRSNVLGRSNFRGVGHASRQMPTAKWVASEDAGSSNLGLPVFGVYRAVSSQGWQWPVLLVDGLLWGFGVCLPLAAVLFIYEPAALYEQLIAFRGELRAAVPGSWAETWAHFSAFLGSHWIFWLLAFGGIISTVLRAYAQKKNEADELRNLFNSGQQASQALSFVLYNLVWGAWLIAGVAMLAWHTPLFPHHFIVLLPPLVLLGAGLLANLMALWPGSGRRRSASYAVVISLVLMIAGIIFNGASMVKANQNTARIVTGGREREALQLLEAVSNPTDFLMGDSQLLIFMADRRTPPPLGDVALVAIKAGQQTSARMIGLTETYQSPAVVQWSLRLPWLPEYLDWVEANFLAERVWDNDHVIYFGRRIPTGQAAPNERLVRLGDSVALRGYQLEAGSVEAGQDLNLRVYWQTNKLLPENYTIFTQLLDRNGGLVAGQDSQPLGGYFPTDRWPVNEIVTDVVRLQVPAELPPGDYTLVTGMYLLETLERLPVLDNASDHVMLTTISVE